MTDIGKAYVQIVPSAQGIEGSITNLLGGESKKAGLSSGANFASNMISKIKGLVAAAGIGAIVKKAFDEGADVQQSFGGLKTIYGDASDAAMKYAQDAYKAGISANDYAEQAVSFGASLKQAFEGDTTKAVEAANTAIMDMTDNAAKMGTPIESIQSAYQGFAKQNYTMLDNLKLGYGGTKTEMERLLKDAEEISGVKYDIGNLGDVYDAIHVIQGKLELTGVAAQEASETFSGSYAAMQAATSNFLAALTLGEDIQGPLLSLGESVGTFLTNNLFPMIGNMLQSLPSLLEGVVPMLLNALNFASNNAGDLITMGMDIIGQLVVGLINNIPAMLKGILDLLLNIGKAIISYDWIGLGKNIIQGLINGIKSLGSALWDTLKSIVGGVVDKAKEWLGISSPSKVFAYMGRMVDEGLAIGLERNTGVVSSAFDDVMNIMSVPDPVINAQNLQYSSNTSPINPLSLSVSFDIDNSGKDITEKDIEKWGSKISDIVNNNLGLMIT